MNRSIAVSLFFCITGICSVFYSCQSQSELDYARYYTNGKKLYDVHCQNCHGADGQGLGKLIPPLTDTIFLHEHRSEIACWVRHGVSDSMLVNNTLYASEMPGNRSLPEIDIAAIVTYVTNSFGNKQGLYDVNNASADLKKCIISK